MSGPTRKSFKAYHIKCKILVQRFYVTTIFSALDSRKTLPNKHKYKCRMFHNRIKSTFSAI